MRDIDNMTKSNTKYNKNLINYKNDKKCSHFGETNKINNSELMVCSYNYIIQHNSYKLLEDKVFNPLIIVDKAHNFLSTLEKIISSNFQLALYLKS